MHMLQEGEGDFMLAFSDSVQAAIFCLKVSKLLGGHICVNLYNKLPNVLA